MSERSLVCLVAFVSLAPLGCAVDPSATDVAPDAVNEVLPAAPGPIGAACVADADCADGATCRSDEALRGGYCTHVDCDATTCPTGSLCAVDRGVTLCLAACSDADVCRLGDGYACIDGACRMPEGMVVVEPGDFEMGTSLDDEVSATDEASHPVSITRRLLVDRFEVTRAAWRATTGSETSTAADIACAAEACPIGDVNFYNAVAYANARSGREGLMQCYTLESCEGDPASRVPRTLTDFEPSPDLYYCARVSFVGTRCEGYRLPTEAEWEFVARAGTTGQLYGERDAIAWYDANAGGAAHEVGLKTPNAAGLYDVVGNMREWVWDPYQSNYEALGAANPVARENDRNCPINRDFEVFARSRVVRGGSWAFGTYEASVARRRNACPDEATADLGFRLVRSMPVPQPILE